MSAASARPVVHRLNADPSSRLLGYSPKGFNGGRRGVGGGPSGRSGPDLDPSRESQVGDSFSFDCGLPVQLRQAAHDGFLRRSCLPLFLWKPRLGLTHIKNNIKKKDSQICYMEIMAGFALLLLRLIESWEPLRWLEQPWKSCSPAAVDPLGVK